MNMNTLLQSLHPWLGNITDSATWLVGLALLMASLLALMIAWVIAMQRKLRSLEENPHPREGELTLRLLEVQAAMAQIEETHTHHQELIKELEARLTQWIKDYETTPPNLVAQTLTQKLINQAHQLQTDIEKLHQRGLDAHAAALNSSLKSSTVDHPQPWDDWLGTYQNLHDQLDRLLGSVMALDDQQDQPARAQYHSELKQIHLVHRDVDRLSQSIKGSSAVLEHIQTLIRRR